MWLARISSPLRFYNRRETNGNKYLAAPAAEIFISFTNRENSPHSVTVHSCATLKKKKEPNRRRWNEAPFWFVVSSSSSFLLQGLLRNVFSSFDICLLLCVLCCTTYKQQQRRVCAGFIGRFVQRPVAHDFLQPSPLPPSDFVHSNAESRIDARSLGVIKWNVK